MRRSERVAEQIIMLMRERGLRPGDPLPSESDLMACMDVGRSSVREALRGLAVLGMVDIRQGQGTFVRSTVPIIEPSAADRDAIVAALARGVTDELLEARAIIEVRIAALAAQRATSEDLAELDRLIAAARAADAARRPAYPLGADFHLAVARAAHNDVLEGFVASYLPVLTERGSVLARLPGYTEWEIRAHDAIRQAIADRDARAAAAQMREHLDSMAVYYDHLAAIPLGSGRLRQGTKTVVTGR